MVIFQFLSPGVGEYKDIPVQEPKPDEVLVRVKYCGICGTDYAIGSGRSGFVSKGQVTFPVRPGHEWSGTVERTGKAVTRVRPGDRVVGDNFVSCGKCSACLRGDYGNCSARMNVGTIDPCWPGALGEYFIIPERHVYRLEDSVPLIDAALCEPLSVAFGGIKKMDIKPESVVVVTGTGSIGMSAAALALHRGSEHVYMIGRNSFKLGKAMELGIAGVINTTFEDPATKLADLTGGRMADYMLECSGTEECLDTCVKIAARAGLIAAIGFYEKNLSDFDIDSFVAKELKMTGIMGEFGNIRAVSEIMASCDLKMNRIITDVVPFDRCLEVMTPENPRSVIKTIVEF